MPRGDFSGQTTVSRTFDIPVGTYEQYVLIQGANILRFRSIKSVLIAGLEIGAKVMGGQLNVVTASDYAAFKTWKAAQSTPSKATK